MTTIFGTDISSYQAGLDVAALPDAFVLIKCTEDVGYTDPDYPAWLSAAKDSGKLAVAYHFIGPSSPAEQAAHLAAHIVDRTIPVMIDFEDEGAFHPTLAQLLALADAIDAAGMHVALAYLPRWMWTELGSPDLTVLTGRGISVVSSAYPVASTAPAGQVYAADGGDTGAGWQPYGGITPRLWQFSDTVADGGQRVDMNAFRGSVAQLAAYLHTAVPGDAPDPAPAPSPAPTSSEDDDMPAFATGQITPGTSAVTMVCVPPANYGSAGWGDVWFSLSADFGDAHVRVAAYVHGQGWSHIYPDVTVPAAGDRVNPFGGPLPTAVQKISVTRVADPDVPLSYLVEAVHK